MSRSAGRAGAGSKRGQRPGESARRGLYTYTVGREFVGLRHGHVRGGSSFLPPA